MTSCEETYMTPRPARAPAADDVATFWPEGAPAATYYRCEVPGSALPANIAYFDDGDSARSVERCHAIGAPAVLQNPWSVEALEAVKGWRTAGTRVVVDVDDNLLIPPAFVVDVKPRWWVERHLQETMPRHRAIVDAADTVIASTPALADAYSAIHSDVRVIPHAVNLGDWRDVKKPDDGVFRVGFAGSMAHYDDFPLIEPAMRWAASQPGVEVVMIGIDPFWRFEYTHIPGVGLTQYRGELARLDVGLCPLIPNEWSICRSDSKPLEYTLAGAAVVTSDAAPFAAWERYAGTAKDAAEFLEVVQWFVRNPETAGEIAGRARVYVESVRSIDTAVSEWRDVLESHARHSVSAAITLEGVPGTLEQRAALIVEVEPLSWDAERLRGLAATTGAVGYRQFQMGECVLSLLERHDGTHIVSIEHSTRYPTWDEVKVARYRLIPDAQKVAMVLPSADDYVNGRRFMFHLFETTDPSLGFAGSGSEPVLNFL